MEASQLDMKLYVELHLSHLDYTQTPKGLAEAYDDVDSLEETSTERLFFITGGFSTWVAHLLTKRAANGRHFEGQAECKHRLSSLDDLDFETRKVIAQMVMAALPSDFLAKVRDLWAKVSNSRSSAPIAQHKRKREYKHLLNLYYVSF
jgi:hypothetical protein